MTSKHEKMARWQRVCILRQVSSQFCQLAHGDTIQTALDEKTMGAVLHAANQKDYITTELPPAVAAAVQQEVRPVYRRLRDLYKRRLGTNNELYRAVHTKLCNLEPFREGIASQWGKARSKVNIVMSLRGVGRKMQSEPNP